MKTDLDCVIHAAKVVCNTFVVSEQMILFYNQLCTLREEKLDYELENTKKECEHDFIGTQLGPFNNWYPVCRKCDFKEDPYKVTPCSEIPPLGTTKASPEMLREVEEHNARLAQECEHEWIMIFNRTLFGEGKETATRVCTFCATEEDSILNWYDRNSYTKKYHSGKDALDKLMRGECCRIKFDSEAWELWFGELVMDIAGNIRSTKYTNMGYESFGQAINQKYFNQTKWLCLKDEK